MKSADEQLSIINKLQFCQVGQPEELRKKLELGRPLKVKFGIDPTGKHVHLGHSVPLRVLRVFQELGHEIHLIIGDFTARIGDPTGRNEVRKCLTEKQISSNAEDYLKQISKIINVDDINIHHNVDWFCCTYPDEFINMMKLITVQQLTNRDDFAKRLENGTPVYMHEMIYPLLQAYDSVEVQADIEVGGQDQMFTLMIGRDFLRHWGKEPQVTIYTPILRGLDGDMRMGKSQNNYIGLTEEPYEMFAKTMSIPDKLMWEWFALLTDKDDAVTYHTDGSILSPLQTKKILAWELVKFYHSEKAANEATQEWTHRVSENKDPTEIPERPVSKGDLKDGTIDICSLLKLMKLTESKNEGRRLISPEYTSITIGDNQRITDPNFHVKVHDGLIVRAGKRRIAKVKLE